MESFTFTPEALETVRTFSADEVASFKRLLESVSKADKIRSRYEEIGIRIGVGFLMVILSAFLVLIIFASFQYPSVARSTPPASPFSLRAFAEAGIAAIVVAALIGLGAGFCWCCARLVCAVRRATIRTAYEKTAEVLAEAFRAHRRAYDFALAYNRGLANETTKWLARYGLPTNALYNH